MVLVLFHFPTIELNSTSRPPDGLDASEQSTSPVLSHAKSCNAITQASHRNYTCHEDYISNAGLAGSKPTTAAYWSNSRRHPKPSHLRRRDGRSRAAHGAYVHQPNSNCYKAWEHIPRRQKPPSLQEAKSSNDLEISANQRDTSRH